MALKPSARASSRNRSVSAKIRLSEASKLICPGARSTLRPRFPNVPVAFWVKAAGLRNCNCGPQEALYGSTPGTRFGRSRPIPVSELSFPVATISGNPLVTRTSGATCQLRTTWLAQPGPIAGVMPTNEALNMWRMS